MSGQDPENSEAPQPRTTAQILEELSFGFDAWLEHGRKEVLDRLCQIDTVPLGRAQFNQLLHLCHYPGVSAGFFKYYWLSEPLHVYELNAVPGYHSTWKNCDSIQSLEHLKWGVYRMYTDGLLFFGDVKTAFQKLRMKSEDELKDYFDSKRFDTEAMRSRGPALPLVKIAKDSRYLIAEKACKSYAPVASGGSALKEFLLEQARRHLEKGEGPISIRNLFDPLTVTGQQKEFMFSADDILNEEIGSLSELEQKYSKIFAAFQSAREAALKNTELFLSMVNDLDVYVATSMRDRVDFRKMADFCERVFRDPALNTLNLRYFDPTVSAADGHENKGLIECLMVKCAKVLIYTAGEEETWGKDAEAAMALSLGKPVIFFCNESRSRFFKEIHPLSRLIEFSTGVAVGAMITSREEEVVELLSRIFENRIEYCIEQREPGYLRLRERLTKSVVRLQTSNKLLRETFWNYYRSLV